MIDGNWIFVSGTTGFDYDTMIVEDDSISQTEQCFKNIVSTLEKAKSTIKDVVRVTYILPDASEFKKC